MFRFTIRELLLVMALAGVSVGWLVDRWQLSKQCAEAAANAEAAAKNAYNLRAWSGQQSP